MIHLPLLRSAWTVGALVGIVGSACGATTPFTYSENFESIPLGDALPTGWDEVLNGFGITAVSPTNASPSQMAELTSGIGFSRATYNGLSAEGIDASQWLNFDMTVTVNSGNFSDTTGEWWGMMARTQADGSGYGFRIRQGALSIIQVTNTNGIFTLNSTNPTTTINSNGNTTVTFRVTNDEVNNEVDIFAEMTTESGLTVSRMFSEAFDSTDSGGTIATPGAISLIGNTANRQFRWDDISITGDALVEVLGLAGDFNGNGQVEQGDLDLVLGDWGNTRGSWSNVEGFDTDSVDQEELDRVLGNWGNSNLPSNLNEVAVPEPVSSLLLLPAVLAGLRRRR